VRSTSGRKLLAVAAVGLFAGAVAGHLRLVHTGTGAALRWSDPSSVRFVVSSTGSADIADDSETTAVRLAARAWNEAPGSSARLVETTSASQRARTDWQSDDLHLVWFDEAGTSGFFAGGGVVAVTPIWFNASGVITDADVIFNGRDWMFTTSGQTGRFDVQDVAAHELGHLLGLDHSPHCAATMYPYVDTAITSHRSLSTDDAGGMRHAYPSGPHATISGVVRRAGGGAIAGAHVVARALDGTPRGATLSASNGDFAIRGLDAGSWEIYAAPLDGPVVVGNLSTTNAVQVDFGATPLGVHQVAAGATTSIGARTLALDHSVVLGRAWDDLPLRLAPGVPRACSLSGSGLAHGSTLESSRSDVAISNVSWFGSAVSFVATAAPGAELGPVDLEARTTLGELAVATGVLDVSPANPQVLSLSPAQASPSGGASILVQGSGFRPGCVVVAGPHIYAQGDGLQYIDDTRLRIELRADQPGARDVVVIDESGVEGRKDDALLVAATPSIEVVFPAAGSAEGGTLVHVVGVDFEAGSSISIDGVVQDETELVDARTLSFRTRPAPAGGPYMLELRSPSGQVASGAFLFHSSPDPRLSSISPASGPSSGGALVSIEGENLPTELEVVFGADPTTGEGGVAAVIAARQGRGFVQVEAPPGPPGGASVLVRDPSGTFVALVAGAYTWESSSSGGGGCSIAAAPSDPGRGAAGFAPVVLCAAWLWLRSRRRMLVATPVAR
jgi:hypothetical protein